MASEKTIRRRSLMNIKEAKIIKTNSFKETEMAKKSREVLRNNGQEVVLVPHGVTDLFITVENDQLAILLQHTDNGYNPIDLDFPTGFNSVSECWKYAEKVMKEAGLPENSCDSDVWEVNPEEFINV